MNKPLLASVACWLIVAANTYATTGTVHYVASSGLHIWPYTNWLSAATNVQAAVDAAHPGDLVLLTNGTYILDLPIVITNAVEIASVNGFRVTVLDGQRQGRCAVLQHQAAVLSGVHCTRGAAATEPMKGCGGAVLSLAGRIRSCQISSSSAYDSGGGAYVSAQSSVSGCVFTANASIFGGGVYSQGAVVDCLISNNTADSNGGGVCLFAPGFISGSTVVDNTSAHGGGIASDGTIANCLIARNRAGEAAGGVLVYPDGTLINCTITANAAPTAGGLAMPSHGLAKNCIAFANSAATGMNWYVETTFPTFSYSCTTPLPSGAGNITNAPQLTPSYRLKSTSPCIDAGTSSNAPATDIDGEARWDHPGHSNTWSIVDIGADEFVDTDADDMADHWEDETFGSTTNSNGSTDGDNDDLDDLGEYENSTDPGNPDTDADQMPDGWEVDNNLDPLADDADQDPDADTMNNGGEYVADTDPRDPQSVLSLINVAAELGGIRVDWKGGRDAWQILECRSDLTSTTEQWTAIFGVPPPTPLTNAIIDLGATNRTLFYRIRAER